jgi:lipopolysaccharide transport system ATP-binding protein
VVDEVLAVGDAEFQKKAVGKMQEVSRGEGRTVLFVSHNMAAVRNLCNNGIVLKDGVLEYSGTKDECVDYYLQMHSVEDIFFKQIDNSDRIKNLPLTVQFISVEFAEQKNHFASDEPIDFYIKIKANRDVDNYRLNMTVYTMGDSPVGSVSNIKFFSIKKNEENTLKFSLVNHNLSAGNYNASFSLGTGNLSTGQTEYDIIKHVLTFKIDKYKLNSNMAFALWPKSWGNIAFQSETILI